MRQRSVGRRSFTRHVDSATKEVSRTKQIPRFSIIIVNYNGGPFLLGCLESVFRYTPDCEVIMIDNNSTDDSVAKTIEQFPKVRLLKNSKNLGFARANNIGLKNASGTWIVLLNPDTIVTERWAEALTEAAATPEIGIVGPKLVRLDRRTIDSAGLMFDMRTGLSYDRGEGETDHGQYDSLIPVPCCSFACVAIRREVVKTVGNLDEKMVLYFDDVDYCVRARLAGWKVLYCPTSIVLHARSGVTPKSASRLRRSAVSYRLRIILKCYSRKNAIRFGLARAFRDFESAVAGVKNRDFEYFRGYFRSPIWNLFNLPVAERARVQSTRKVSDAALTA